MTAPYTKVHFDFATLPWLTSPRKKLDLQAVALGLINIPPGEGYSFYHSHREQEEVYIVIEGDGAMAIGEELVVVEKGDVIRVSPESKRAIRAGENGIFVICAGGVPQGFPRNPNARYMIDDGIPYYDEIPPWYEGREDIARKNQELKRRMSSSRGQERSG